jgi:hypothetical protein
MKLDRRRGERFSFLCVLGAALGAGAATFAYAKAGFA